MHQLIENSKIHMGTKKQADFRLVLADSDFQTYFDFSSPRMKRKSYSIARFLFVL